MSHHVYTTRGVVLGSMSIREADKVFLILTRELGLVYATARGIRSQGSKLRSMLMEMSVVRISLVRASRGWRVTTATLVEDTTNQLSQNRQKVEALSKVTTLLKRLVRGEERNLKLYDEFESDLFGLIEVVADEGIEDWEVFAVSRLLANLGYLADSKVPTDLKDARNKRKDLVLEINEGLHSSGLHNV